MAQDLRQAVQNLPHGEILHDAGLSRGPHFWGDRDMKIVFLTPDTTVDRRIVLEAQSLVRRGHSAVIIADLGPGKDQDETFLPVRIINALSPTGSGARGSGISWLKEEAKSRLGRSPALRRMTRKAYYSLFSFIELAKPAPERKLHPLGGSYLERALAENGDVCIACDLPMLPAAEQAIRKKGSALIYDAHEFYTEQQLLSGIEKRLAREVEEALLKKTRLVITINESIAGLFAARYGIRKPHVIYNCTTPPPTFDALGDHDVIREKLGLPPSTRIVLFQGGFLPGRNLENLVKAAGTFPQETALVLLGYGDFRRHLEDLARNGGVYFIEAVSQRELLHHTASADLGIIPYQPVDLNTKFCTPNKLFEFLQAGIPLLADGRLEELRRFIDNEKIGFLRDLSSPESIAKAIEDTLGCAEDLAAAKASCLRAAPNYTWEKEGEKFADLVEEVSKQGTDS
jgi:glycosyltransferase involved in cell wall biosynthesis